MPGQHFSVPSAWWLVCLIAIFVFTMLYLLSVLNLLERKSACFEDEESELFIEVDCFNVEPVLCPAPEGLSQQQVMNIPFSCYPNLCNSLCVNLLLKEIMPNAGKPMVGYFSSTAGEKMYFGIYIGEREELSWGIEEDIRGMQVRLQWLAKSTLKCLLLQFTFSALSAIWEAPVPDWAEAAERQETEDDLLSRAWDPAVPLPVPDCPGEPRGWVGQPGDDWGCLCGIGKSFFYKYCTSIIINSRHQLWYPWIPSVQPFLNQFGIFGIYDDCIQHSQTPPILTILLHVKDTCSHADAQCCTLFSYSVYSTLLLSMAA